MGIELDVLVGHPEHELLFVATQVARAAGLKNPHMSATKYRNLACNAGKKFLTIGSLVEAYTESRDFIGSMEGKRKNLEGCLYLSGLMDKSSMSLPKEPNGASLRTTTVLMTEAKVYDMMLKGKAPQTESFRRWVTEEVLPTIRKTGKYDAESSTNPAVLRT